MTSVSAPTITRNAFRKFLTPALAVSLLAVVGCAGGTYRDTSAPIATVSQVDLTKYQGRWFEIARYPVWFERDCENVTATYIPRDDDKITVVNRCERDGVEDISQGLAWSVSENNARLKVTFTPALPFIAGDYWILGLDEEYQTAVVGGPSGTSGWILSRSSEISPQRRAWAEEILRQNGYDLRELITTPQSN